MTNNASPPQQPASNSGGSSTNVPSDEWHDGVRAVEPPLPQQPRRFCVDCGHWEHDPGACDGLGHEWDGPSGLPVATDCTCEVHDDQRAVEPPLPVAPEPTIDEKRAAVNLLRESDFEGVAAANDEVVEEDWNRYQQRLASAGITMVRAPSVPLPVDPDVAHIREVSTYLRQMADGYPDRYHPDISYLLPAANYLAVLAARLSGTEPGEPR